MPSGFSQRPRAVEPDLVDLDIYAVNNTVRHVVDAAKAGLEKTELVAERCRALNPFIDVRVHATLLGHLLDQEELLEELTSEATVVVDTTSRSQSAHCSMSRDSALHRGSSGYANTGSGLPLSTYSFSRTMI